MKTLRAIATVLALLPFPVLADGLEIQGQRYIIAVGQAAKLPSTGIIDVTVANREFADVTAEKRAKVVTIRALKPGQTQILVKKASGTVIAYDLVVR